MGTENAETPQGAGMTHAMFKLDERLDALEKEHSKLTGRLANLEKPFWKNIKVLTPIAAVVFVVVGYIASLWADDPEIPRILHSKVLLTDRALALTMKRAREDGDDSYELNGEFKTQFKEHLVVDDTKLFFADLASKHGLRTYSGAETYSVQTVPLGRLGCLIIDDSEMREVLVSATATAPDTFTALEQSCMGVRESTEVRFADFSTLVVPFHANTKDHVELFVRVHAFDPREGAKLTETEGLIEAVLFQGSPIEFVEVKDDVYKAKLELREEETRHAVAIDLTDIGQARVDSSRNEGGDITKEYIITLFATVIVTPPVENPEVQ